MRRTSSGRRRKAAQRCKNEQERCSHGRETGRAQVPRRGRVVLDGEPRRAARGVRGGRAEILVVGLGVLLQGDGTQSWRCKNLGKPGRGSARRYANWLDDAGADVAGVQQRYEDPTTPGRPRKIVMNGGVFFARNAKSTAELLGLWWRGRCGPKDQLALWGALFAHWHAVSGVPFAPEQFSTSSRRADLSPTYSRRRRGCDVEISWRDGVARGCDVEVSWTRGRGGAAAATWILRGDGVAAAPRPGTWVFCGVAAARRRRRGYSVDTGSRRRRGRDVDIPRRRGRGGAAAATWIFHVRRGCGDAAAGTWIFCGDAATRRHGSSISASGTNSRAATRRRHYKLRLG